MNRKTLKELSKIFESYEKSFMCNYTVYDSFIFYYDDSDGNYSDYSDYSDISKADD